MREAVLPIFGACARSEEEIEKYGKLLKVQKNSKGSSLWKENKKQYRGYRALNLFIFLYACA